MGMMSRFHCEACGYEAEVSGGDDVGMDIATTTIVCLDCRALYDIVTSDSPWKPSLSKREFRLECPKDAEHRCRKWEQGHKCPRCNGDMQSSGMVALWD